MNYQYFTPTPTSAEEAKSLYRKLAREHHPDMGGTVEAMQAINAEYAQLLTELEHGSQRTRQAKAHDEGKKTAADYHDLDKVIETLRVKIEFALNLEGVNVELCGLWVWLTGETKVNKEAIKAEGFRWAREKEAWFFAGVPSFNREKRTLDEIRNMHGSQTFTRSARQPMHEDAELLNA
jgi:hypothetical protein